MAIIELADLHTHTTASDGLHSPSEVVAMAAKAGLAAIAITDHDTIAGVSEAQEAGKKLGIQIVPGVELSTNAEGQDVHVLGYFTDNGNDQWLSRLKRLRGGRSQRNEEILKKLRHLGLEVQMEDVHAAAMRRAGVGLDALSTLTIGRPHIAQALIDKGFAADMEEAFRQYLAEGAAAYVSQSRVHPMEAIGWIKEAGGVAVIAHPGLYGADDLVEELCRSSADGLEVFHSDHGPQEEERYSAMAKRCGVLMTGGSDFHGLRGDQSYHGALGSTNVPLSRVDELHARRRQPAAT
ncbi:PHP domain-containing protein [Paenibacillus sp. CAU 1782]